MEELLIKNPRWNVVGKYLPGIFTIRDDLNWGFNSTAEINESINDTKQLVETLLKSYKVKSNEIKDDILLIYILIKDSFQSYRIDGMEKTKQLSTYYKRIAKAIRRLDDYYARGNIDRDGYKIQFVSNFPSDSEWYFEPIDDLPMPFKDKILVKIFKHFEDNWPRDYPGYITSNTKPENQIRKIIVIGFFNYLKNELRWKHKECEGFMETFANELHIYLPDQFKGITAYEVQHTIKRYGSKKLAK